MRKEIKLVTPDKFTLDGVFTEIEGSSKGVVFVHGMTVSKDDEGIFVRAEPKLNELGFSTLRFDFRAHGKSSGDSIKDFTISGELVDLGTAVEWVKEQGVESIGIAAASFGGGIAALYVGQKPEAARSLFLANPVLDYDAAFLHPTTVWAIKTFINLSDRLKRFGFIELASRRFKMGKPLADEMKKYSPCQQLQNYSGPILIVHSDRDEKVDINHVKKCFVKLNNRKKEFVIIKGSPHGFHIEPYKTQVVDMMVNFLSHE